MQPQPSPCRVLLASGFAMEVICRAFRHGVHERCAKIASLLQEGFVKGGAGLSPAAGVGDRRLPVSSSSHRTGVDGKESVHWESTALRSGATCRRRPRVQVPAVPAESGGAATRPNNAFPVVNYNLLLKFRRLASKKLPSHRLSHPPARAERMALKAIDSCTSRNVVMLSAARIQLSRATHRR